MNWKFSGAAIITVLLLTFNAQNAAAQTNANSTIPRSPEIASLTSKAPRWVPKGRATIVVRVLDSSGAPLGQQAFVELLSDGTATPIGSAITGGMAYAEFHADESHNYTVKASAAGYETAKLRLQTYRHDDYYQAILRLDAEPARKTEVGDPLSPAAMEEAEKGLAAFESADYRQAVELFNKALQLAPQNANLNFLQGISLLESHHLSEAQRSFQRATSLDPRHVPSLTALGRVRIQQREFRGAAVALKKAISINPTAWAPHLLMGSVDLARREFAGAVEQSREAIQLGQAAANSSGLLMGEALAAQGQRDQARDVLTAFVKAAPEDPGAATARELLRRLQQNDPPANAELVETALISARSVTIANSVGSEMPWRSWHPVGVDEEVLPIATGMACPAQTVLDNATLRVDEFVENVNRFDAIEQIVNQDLTRSGRVISTEKRKFDYEVNIRRVQFGDLEVDEARNGTDAYDDFPDRIATLGLPSLALVFHERYRDGYVFDCEGLGEWNGQATWLVHFRQRADRVPQIRGYNVNGVLYPIGLTGRAWIAADSFQIVHMEADMINPVPTIKLRYEHQAINYGPVDFKTGHTQLWLPKSASLYFDFEHHRFHRVHTYGDYQLFSVSTSQTISPPKQLAAKRVAMAR
ncbi:MAG TPA: tetratricopeptide repeat protein [Candidatus Acidoferrum sp.]|nr:tetratricopeptide repeat protein [Candidatus Acidoferrum sp.]